MLYGCYPMILMIIIQLPNTQNVHVCRIHSLNDHFAAMFYTCWIGSALGDMSARYLFLSWWNFEMLHTTIARLSSSKIYMWIWSVGKSYFVLTCVMFIHSLSLFHFNMILTALVSDGILFCRGKICNFVNSYLQRWLQSCQRTTNVTRCNACSDFQP